MVVHEQRTTAKTEFGAVPRVQTNTISLWTLPYKCFVKQNYSALCTDIPYQAGMISHATNNETAKIMVAPYQADTVNHATTNKMVKITNTIFVQHVQWTPSTIQRQIKNYTFGQKDTRVHG